MGDLRRYLFIGVVLPVFGSACLGDDPDHLDPQDTAAIQSPKASVSAIPEALHTRLLADIGTNLVAPNTSAVTIKVQRAADWATTVDAPELCQKCTVTLLHHMGGGDMNNPLSQEVTVYDDQANVSICTLSLSLYVDAKTVIRADTCGATAKL